MRARILKSVLDVLIDSLHRINIFIVVPALILIVLSDVLLRTFVNMPLVWAHEVLGLLLLFLFFAELPFCIRARELLSVDVLFHRLGHRLRVILENLTVLLLISFGCILIWQGYIGFVDSLEYEEQAYTIALPFWPFYLVMAFSGVLITSQQTFSVFTSFIDSGSNSSESNSLVGSHSSQNNSTKKTSDQTGSQL